MSKIAKGLFGGSSSKQQSTSNQASWNEAFPQIQSQFNPVAGRAATGTNAMANLLGLGTNPAAQQQAFKNFRDSTGYNFQVSEGEKAITGNQALKGLLNSGSTMKALTGYRQNLANSSFNDYLQNIQGLTNSGLQAGALISGAGDRSIGESQSTGKSSSKKGIGQALGTAATMVAMSDRRLKTNIKKLYTRIDGLNVYSFDYTYKPGRFVGVMADEVERLKPEALGPVVDGYQSVDYSKIGEL